MSKNDIQSEINEINNVEYIQKKLDKYTRNLKKIQKLSMLLKNMMNNHCNQTGGVLDSQKRLQNIAERLRNSALGNTSISDNMDKALKRYNENNNKLMEAIEQVFNTTDELANEIIKVEENRLKIEKKRTESIEKTGQSIVDASTAIGTTTLRLKGSFKVNDDNVYIKGINPFKAYKAV